MKNFRITLIALCLFTVACQHAFAQMQKLKIADNNRFLVKEDGTPFVWIGDTNWFFAKLEKETIKDILDDRSAQGFTIMFVSCREKMPDGTGPGSINDPNEKWWSYLDDYVEMCEERNLYVGITLGWWNVAKRNTKEDLYNYGKWVGDRYKDKNNVIWLTLGETGSHLRKDEIPVEKKYALVNGIRDGDTGDKLLTIHADFRRGTSISEDGEIVDFNNWQTSQWCCIDDLPRKDQRKWTVWEAIQYDYDKLYNGEPKPTLDSEAWYEGNKDFCGGEAFNMRRRAYFTIFAGAFGHTYGAGGLWDGLSEPNGCSKSASDALQLTGAKHMGYLSDFLHGLGEEFLKLRPDQSIIHSGNSDNYDFHIQSMVSNDQKFMMFYSASDQSYTLDLSLLSSDNNSAIWYNPRSNKYLNEESFQKTKANGWKTFDPPGAGGAGNDWVLVVGDHQLLSNFRM